jgi:hypothetical protein
VLTVIREAAAVALTLLPPERTIVRAGESLQAALDQGGIIELEAGATFTGTFVGSKPGTRLVGNGARLQGLTGPAFLVRPGTVDVQVTALTAETQWDQTVIRIGENTANQTTIDAAPAQIVLTGVIVPKHRGKCAFEIHARQSQLVDCEAHDTYDPALRDSKGIYVCNAPGDIQIRGGYYEAGSENVLFGGDAPRIPGLIPAGFLFDGVTLVKPLDWRTNTDPVTGAAINENVKTIFEVKNGQNILVKNSVLDGCWKASQTGYAITLTPRWPGSAVRHITFEDVTVRNASALLNLLGYDDGTTASQQTTDITFRRVNATVSHVQFGGTGVCAQIQSEPARLTFDANVFRGDGGNTIYIGKGLVVQADGTKRDGGPIEGFVLTNNDMTFGLNGLNTFGKAYALDWQLALPGGIIDGNTFRGADPRSVKNLPANNTFVPA